MSKIFEEERKNNKLLLDKQTIPRSGWGEKLRKKLRGDGVDLNTRGECVVDERETPVAIGRSPARRKVSIMRDSELVVLRRFILI